MAGTIAAPAATAQAGTFEPWRPMMTRRDLVSQSRLAPNDQLQARRALYD